MIWRQSQCRPWCSPKPDSQLEPRLNHLRSHRNSCTVHLRRCRPGDIWYKRLCNWCINTFHFCIAFRYPLLATYRYKVNLYFLSLGIIGSKDKLFLYHKKVGDFAEVFLNFSYSIRYSFESLTWKRPEQAFWNWYYRRVNFKSGIRMHFVGKNMAWNMAKIFLSKSTIR